MGLGVVLNEQDAVLVAEGLDGFVVGATSIEVNEHERLRP